MKNVWRRWSGRIGGAVLLAAIGFAIAVWLDFEPRPFPYAVWAVVVIAMTYLVIDTVEAPVSQWQHPIPRRSDRVDEVTSDLRVLSSHQHADHPSAALAERLVALARGRDPRARRRDPARPGRPGPHPARRHRHHPDPNRGVP